MQVLFCVLQVVKEMTILDMVLKFSRYLAVFDSCSAGRAEF